jgi:flagellar hook-associated protein 1 FlgK
MSFTTIRNIATSSLMATSVQTALASSNIANADVDGYSRKVGTQVSTVTGGEGSGTTITGITSKVNKFLVQAVARALSDVGSANVTETYTDRLQSLFGQTIGGSDAKTGTSLANLLASLETAVTNLAATPEGENLQASVVDKFTWIATQLREVSRGVQDLRAEADTEIKKGVDDVNNTLNSIADLNREIGLAAARGDSTADLEDKRNTALQDLAEKMDVTYFINSGGAMQIYTTTGQALLTSKVHEISYVAAGGVSAGTVFNDITVDGVNITASFKSGEISGLIKQRDVTLTAAQDELDEFTTKFIDAVNAVHNTGTTLPPPDTLTGTQQVDLTDGFAPSSVPAFTVRFAVAYDDGTLANYADVDLSSCATVNDVVNAINGLGFMSATVNAAGRLEVSSTTANAGVSMVDLQGSVGPNGEGFSDYFGLNDLLEGTGAVDVFVRKDLQAQPGTLSNSTLSSAATLTIGAKVLTSGDAKVANALYDTLTGAHSFSSAGRLGASSTSFASYAADIVSDVASVAANAATASTAAENVHNNLSDSLAARSGVNIDEETAWMSELEKLYATASQIIATLNAMFDSLLAAAKSA